MSPVHRNLNTKPRSTSCDFVSPDGDENGERKRERESTPVKGSGKGRVSGGFGPSPRDRRGVS